MDNRNNKIKKYKLPFGKELEIKRTPAEPTEKEVEIKKKNKEFRGLKPGPVGLSPYKVRRVAPGGLIRPLKKK